MSYKIKFNSKSYENLLKKIINAGYRFRRFRNALNIKEKSLLLRHDIDVSPKLALQMAKLEYKNNVQATFFFMLRSPFYNLFSRVNNSIVHAIIALGHEIAIHYDAAYFNSKKREGGGGGDKLKMQLNEEIDILEKNFNCSIKVVSFHQPTNIILSGRLKITQINTYEKKFFKDIKYISDSNMIFKENPIEVIESQKFPKIQLLIHPIWWMAEGFTTEEKWMNAIKKNFELEQKQALLTEAAYGKKKVIFFKN